MWTLFTRPSRQTLQASTALILEVYILSLRLSTPWSSLRHDQKIISSS